MVDLAAPNLSLLQFSKVLKMLSFQVIVTPCSVEEVFPIAELHMQPISRY